MPIQSFRPITTVAAIYDQAGQQAISRPMSPYKPLLADQAADGAAETRLGR